MTYMSVRSHTDALAQTNGLLSPRPKPARLLDAFWPVRAASPGMSVPCQHCEAPLPSPGRSGDQLAEDDLGRCSYHGESVLLTPPRSPSRIKLTQGMQLLKMYLQFPSDSYDFFSAFQTLHYVI